MDDKEIERSDLIDRYLSGHLTETEMSRLKKQLEEDAALKAELENYEISKEAIRNYGLRNELKSIRKAMLQEQVTDTVSVQPEAQVVPLHRYWMRVAATILIVIAGFLAIQFATLSGEKLYEEKAFPYEVTVSRNADEATDSQNQDIRRSYASENFEETVRQYESLATPSATAIFIAGNAYLQLNQSEKAKAAFQQLLDNNIKQGTHFFEEHARYYLALSYLQAGDYDQALSRFKEIKASNGSYKQYISDYFLLKLKMLDWKDG